MHLKGSDAGAGSGSAPRPQPLTLSAALVARLHTCLAYTAFSTALIVGCLCHYKKIVKNGVAGYPQEWFPSVSATIGDWYPERNIFQVLIALTAGPRLALVLFQYYLHYPRRPLLSMLVFVFGMIRTLSCGGWVYITSSDDHDVHDVFMITYMVCNIPWMVGGIACTPAGTSLKRRRVLVSSAFFISIIPLVYFFLQHKVHRIPGAYTHYSFFEWGLIFLDVLYDAMAEQEFKEADLQITFGPKVSAPVLTVDKEDIPSEPLVSILRNGNGNSAQEPSFDSSSNGRISIHQPLFVVQNLRPHFSFLSDVYLSYIFWSIFTSLIPTLFYFSVWELGIAGHELALLSTLSPFLLGIPPLLRWARTRGGQTTLRLLEFVALAAYALESPGLRLLAVAPGIAVLVLRQAAKWSADEDADSEYQGILMGLGLVVAALSKHLNHSNNPVWPFVNRKEALYNKIGLALALLAVYESYTRPMSFEKLSRRPAQQKANSAQKQHWLTAALPLGSLLFSLHNLASDPSTLIAWSWTGYENGAPRGPVPHLHAALTLLALCAGLLYPILLASGTTPHALDVRMHGMYFVLGALGARLLYVERGWKGYMGGLGFVAFLVSIASAVVLRAAQVGKGRVGKTFGGAFVVYCLLNLASVFTVAYAFVPGGWVLRERTDCVLIAQMACLALAFEFSRLDYVQLTRPGSMPSKAVLPVAKLLLAVVSVLSVLGTLYRWPSTPPRPFQPGPRIFNAGIWTVHFGIDNEGRDSQRGMTDLIRDMRLDVVGLLETDLHRTAFGHRDLTRVAVEESGYYVDIGPGPNSHTWGAALLSKFPIINSTHHLLPSPHGELAPAIEAVLDVYGTKVTVVVAHNGQEEDPLDRELQSKELARIMAASYPRPVVFLGYVVTKPHAERPAPYKIMVEDGRVHDIDHEDEDRWCEYIFYRGLYRTSYARVSRGIITDTELQIGQFALPKHGVGVTNDTLPARYLRAFKEQLPEHHWFFMEYYGDENQGGVNGHFYHVFGTPLYYNFPEDAVL
ncbi:putative frag1/DRAM/Sfk1 family protein [Lyophyllum shimeji]|uniref:Frag1/DRAM/Sfk1 family protein n=1 Tax=Lyophyllum shimeji TaxID=47721 RepID=A0A9P3PQ49_LYOSH|nr:putative frag1/DRAM/Sfk1 family protein [Lyophyllum shimeji]